MKHTSFPLVPVIFILSFLSPTILWSQDLKKEVNNYSNFEVFKTYLNTIKQDSLKKLEAKIFLNKAKLELNTVKIADGYFILSELNTNTTKGIDYADSIIQVSKNLTHFKYPGFGYFQKGLQLYYASEYKEAFDCYLKADTYATKYKNDFLKLRVKHSIGALKSVTNENTDALVYFKQNLDFFKNEENKSKYEDQYLKALSIIADSYNRNKKLDSAIYIIEKGIKESNRLKNHSLYPYFLMYYGFSKKEKKEFETAAIDSLQKGLSLINVKNDKKTAAKAYIVISEIYTGQKKHKEALLYLKKVDSMYLEFPNKLPLQALEAYNLLNNYYTFFQKDKERLKTIDKIIGLDSVISIKKGFKYLKTEIIKKYDIPILIKDRDDIIKRLQNQNQKNSRILNILLVAIATLILILIYFFYRNKLNRKRFNNLLAKQNNKNNKTSIKSSLNNETKKALPIGLSKELVASIIEKIDAFENSKKYTKTNYTLNSLAKELNTNSAYLSKIINTYKKVNFSNYLNGLRIDNIIERLTTDKVLRSYTINAISEEAGFNNVQSFSVAFHKKTGIYPSYFIKQLKGIKT